MRETKMAETRFGRLAIRDPRLVHDLRRGRVTSDRVTASIRAFLAAQAMPPRPRRRRSSTGG
ncbi:hypothetical protein [Sphingomonas aracearum]|uniref:hypothetical protein n=1 Tax=Sphingomonas aracearum TaxID=2283317 RepID=UPI0030B8606D